MKDHHSKWDLKFMDDYYSKTPLVDDFDLSPEDKLARDSDDKPTGQQDEPAHVPPQPTFPVDTAITSRPVSRETNEEGVNLL